ncbi:Gamma-glutamylcyclotransferase [Penicillium camemberti]|uniref:gamma-glutamylcyclotransferase n=1 Tax=Penicillium camemberti (strain FM 013) TaxID=1429867 RepID=A0A0G4P8D5_PENC3|nr:Gamma-glutamylcyclotransferase [Penicillium camemberti]
MASRSARRPERWYYFAYGSNMSLKQMAERCPSSLFKGKGRIEGYRWQINQRGVANIVESRGDYVEGLVYQIDATDKRKLNRSEGVALGFYNDEHLHAVLVPLLHCGIKTFHVAKELEMDDQPDIKKPEHRPASRYPGQESLEMVEALVYVSREYKDDGLIRSEYIARMEKAIIDGRKMGLSEQFLTHIDRTIHRELPRPNNGTVRTNYGPSARMEAGGTSHQPHGILESTRPRQEQNERVSTIRPSYPRYASVITVRPRYQDFRDLDGNLRYADERPHRPTYDTGRQSETREWDRGRSPTRLRLSREWDEWAGTGLTTLINSRYRVGGYAEQFLEYRRRGSSTPF